jgi:hypothetical protein
MEVASTFHSFRVHGQPRHQQATGGGGQRKAPRIVPITEALIPRSKPTARRQSVHIPASTTTVLTPIGRKHRLAQQVPGLGPPSLAASSAGSSRVWRTKPGDEAAAPSGKNAARCLVRLPENESAYQSAEAGGKRLTKLKW